MALEFTLLNNFKFINAIFSDREEIKIILSLFIFFVINILKVTLYNLYVANARNWGVILYKFVFTVAFTLLAFGVFNLNNPVALAIFYTVQGVYLYINLSYYNFYHYFLHLYQAWVLLPEVLDVARHFAVPKNPNLILIFADMPLLIYLMADSFQDGFFLPGLAGYNPQLCLLALSLIVLMQAINIKAGYSLVGLIKEYPATEVKVVERYGTLTNILVDLFKFKSVKKMVKQYSYGRTVSSGEIDGRPVNIIAIQVESMDANSVGAVHRGEYVMPYLHSLTQSSIYYPYTLCYHKAGGTSDAEFSIVNSVEPLGNYPSIKISSYDYPNSFADRFLENGYHTAVFHGNRADYYHRDKAFAKMGFQNFYDIEKMDMKDVGWGAPDHEVYGYALNKIKNAKAPFFYYVITMSSHCLFTNARNYHSNTWFNGIEYKVLRDYYNSLSYVDQSIKAFVENIKAAAPNTCIMIWGDHGPGIDDKFYKQATLEVENNHLDFVPLFIITPDNKAFKEEEKAASFLDIAPTLLEVANIPYEYRTDGYSLISANCLKGEIPYRGKKYSRTFLFDQITKNS